MQNFISQAKNESKQYWPFVFLFVILIAADELVKSFAGRIFRNYAFAFSLPLPPAIIYFVYAAVLLAIVYYVAKNFREFAFVSYLAWTLIFAGAASNVAERLVLGYVRDFIYISFYRWTGVYNTADFYILTGIFLLLLPLKKYDIKSF